MKRATLLTVVIAIPGFGVDQAQNVDSSGDEDAIRRVVVTMTEGFNRHDGKAAAQMYQARCPLRDRSRRSNEWAACDRKRPYIDIEYRAKNSSQRTLDVAVKFLRPDVALVYVTNELSGLVAPDGQALPSQQELSLRVLVKEAGAWRVAAFQNTMVRPFNNP